MIRTARLILFLVLVSAAAGAPVGMALGSFATGEAPLTRMAGSSLPNLGVHAASTSYADAHQPAAVAYAQHDRYAASAAY